MGKGHKYDDPAGAEWQAKADKAWAEAEGKAEQLDDPDQPAIVFYEAPALPNFDADKPEHVQRTLFGRFLENRDTATVHDAHNAQPACRLDAIKNGTFYHFAEELPDDYSPCKHCSG